MPRHRKSPVDEWLDLYISMSPEDRAVAKSALSGADRVLSRSMPPQNIRISRQDHEAFEDLGERAAEHA